MIGIIDYGMGNLHSVYKAFRSIGANAEITSSPVELKKYDKIVLPGVGDFRRGMINLESAGFVEAIKNCVLDNEVHLLGICLGMQLLTTFSEEGEISGMNLIKARTLHLRSLGISPSLKVPHMGWNELTYKSDEDIFSGCLDKLYYFVHSYAVICDNVENVLCRTSYGVTFDSGIKSGNITGLQFHPEKSHKDGLKILKNFASI